MMPRRRARRGMMSRRPLLFKAQRLVLSCLPEILAGRGGAADGGADEQAQALETPA